MALAGIDDINSFLPEDKLVVYTSDDDAMLRDAERIIKARLAAMFSPATLASWTTPGDTFPPATVPPIIQGIAARLVAALFYAKTFSSEVAGLPEYAQWLYDQAMKMIDEILLGLLVIPPDEGGETIDTGGHLTRDMFWPNNDTPVDPRFRRSDVF